MIETIAWKNGRVRIIDQTRLPHNLAYIECPDVKTLWGAIKKLQVRGAPAIGVAASLGVVLGIKNSRAKDPDSFMKELDKIIRYLASARPTAVNLFWALERMRACALRNSARSVPKIKGLLLKEAFKVIDEDKRQCRRMAAFGARLIKDGDRILTHCNAGALATADYGTALGVLYRAKAEGKRIRVYADETRPLLQGARLTAWELMRDGIDVTLICDNMAASLMEQGKIDKVIVGADRIAANGDTANKIGTYNLAVLAAYHKIPFYVVAPVSTLDLTLKNGRKIPIEERGPGEVREIAGRLIAPRNVKVYNPAFDVTPNKLITVIVTEKGIFHKPFRGTFPKLNPGVSPL
ncbi:MAG: S-methyl-5-thioribose-1-phosphate isomerase [Candidatus Omnitrophica bacterium]|nr:S-methyl-5-thioribose-1-phosphate isomerase [Candidatus Omnitrophota bacterium]